MAFWLLKSEPDVFGWSHLTAKGPAGAEWDGVRNYQARNNLRAMALGDLCFFYHSRQGLEIVGVMEVIATAHPDSTADKPIWDAVDVAARATLNRPVSLERIKATPELAEMALVKSSRLSVQPVRPEEWDLILQMGGGLSPL